MAFPTLSQVEGASWAFLRANATAWSRLAHTWEAAFTEIRDASASPGDTQWTGAGAEAFQQGAAADVVKVRDAADLLVKAAGIASRGADAQDGNKHSVLDAVNAAEREDFHVGELQAAHTSYDHNDAAGLDSFEAGMLADCASGLDLNPAAQVFASRADNDIITMATGFTLGPDPTTVDFGAIRLAADPGPPGIFGTPGTSIAAHSSYRNQGNRALLDFGAVIAGVQPPYVVVP
ncbi:hypothetical protein [Mycobacterium sp. UM_Kg1]|uniref:hypothetical protein n=1 Tax=Mycobacterium sp. UM_Kg1 TaxID=1545691 RepID=UPI00061AE327|nr:hypothetical protein [Mycobacterium sp. UM_Kg1]